MPTTPEARQLAAEREVGEVQVSQQGNQASVRLLREGIAQVIGAEAGLNMAHRDLLIESRQGRGNGCGVVTLHQREVWPVGGELLLQPLQVATGDVSDRLLGGHQVMLAGDHHPGAEIVRLLKGPDHRRKLYGFRTGARCDRDAMNTEEHFRLVNRIMRKVSFIKAREFNIPRHAIPKYLLVLRRYILMSTQVVPQQRWQLVFPQRGIPIKTREIEAIQPFKCSQKNRRRDTYWHSP